MRRTTIIEDTGYPPLRHPDYYKPDHKYFVTNKDSQLIRFKPSVAQLASLFPEQKKVLKQYIKEQHLKLSDERDLIRVITYVNAIENP